MSIKQLDDFKSGIKKEWKALRKSVNALINEMKDCLLYTSDAADDLPCVDLGGRRIIK